MIKKTQKGYCAMFSYREEGRTKRRQKTFRDIVSANRWLNHMRKLRDDGGLKTLQGVTLRELAELKLEIIRLKMSPQNRAHVERLLGDILSVIHPTTNVRDINEHTLSYLVETLQKRRSKNPPYNTISPKTVKHRIDMMMSLLLIAKQKGYINVVPRVQFCGKTGDRLVRLTLDRFLKTIECLDSPFDLIAFLGLFTAMRLQDLKSVRTSDFDFGSGTLLYRSSKTQRYDLQANLPGWLIDKVRQYGSESRYACGSSKTGRPFGHQTIRNRIKRACDQAGVPHWTPHELRHLAAELGMELTGDTQAVQEWVGWMDQAMMRRYTRPQKRVNGIINAIDQCINPGPTNTKGPSTVVDVVVDRPQNTTHPAWFKGVVNGDAGNRTLMTIADNPFVSSGNSQ